MPRRILQLRLGPTYTATLAYQDVKQQSGNNLSLFSCSITKI